MSTPFPFIAGAISLCFVDTVSGRGTRNVERLKTSDDLSRWFGESKVIHGLEVCVTETELNEARYLREAIHDWSDLLIGEASPGPHLVALVNSAAGQAPPRPHFENGALQFRAANPFRAALSAVAEDALTIFALQPSSVRKCPECRMVFLDTSRPGRRIWCSSSTNCGNRLRVRAFRARQSHPEGEA